MKGRKAHTDETIKKIQSLYATGLFLQKELARFFNVDRKTISNYIKSSSA